MTRFRHVLVWMKPGYLGDAVMATPLLDALAARSERVTVLAGPSVQELLQDRSDSLAFLPSGPEQGFWGPVRAGRLLRTLRPDAVIVLNRSFRSALGAWAGGVPIRAGHRTDARSWLLTHSVPYGDLSPEAECGLELLRSIVGPVPDCRPSLRVTEAERAAGLELCRGATVGVQPGARYESKRLPVETSADSLRKLHAQGVKVVLLGGREERATADEVATLAGVPVVNLVGAITLREAMGVLANLNVMAGADTGLMHIAAALGCPTATVFGPNPPEKWAHRHPPHRVLVAPGGDMAKISVESLVAACLTSPAIAAL
ncbi:MAG: glycosyltransferase family 9 protein [Fimbriimonadaceae bacterium]|nr:glycosyltransferase family 9 protein [Chthonomonadaceae bacterium]MCO5297624.1 glycosyltransferase family 9 protein [Fimbriimonadaceae bacterium]